MNVSELAQVIRAFVVEQQKIDIVRRRRSALVRQNKQRLENNLAALDRKE